MVWFVFYKIIFDRFDIKRFLVLIKEVVVFVVRFLLVVILFCFEVFF